MVGSQITDKRERVTTFYGCINVKSSVPGLGGNWVGCRGGGGKENAELCFDRRTALYNTSQRIHNDIHKSSTQLLVFNPNKHEHSSVRYDLVNSHEYVRNSRACFTIKTLTRALTECVTSYFGNCFEGGVLVSSRCCCWATCSKRQNC